MNIPANVRRVLDHVLGSAGRLAQNRRENLFTYSKASADAATQGIDIEPALAPFVDKVLNEPYKVIDRDIERLSALGLSEDEIFELTVAVALGAATGRLTLTHRMIEKARQEASL